MQDIFNGIATYIKNLEQMITGPILSLAGLFVALIILILSLLVLWRIIMLSRSSNLIIEPINNASGNDTLDKVLPGLTQLAREMLVKQLEEVRDQLIEYKELGPEKCVIPHDLGDADNKLSALLTSLKDVTSGNIKTIVYLLNFVFIPRGTKVTITFQPCIKNTITTQLHSGISFEVKDLRGRQKPTLYTIWGPDRAYLEDIFSLEKYYIDILDPAMYSLALELFQRIIANTKQHKSTESDFQAELFNFIGEFYLSAGSDYDMYTFFYEKALWKFKQAAKRNNSLSHPYENIGDAYYYMGQTYKATGGIEESRILEYILKAIDNYKLSLKLLSSGQTKNEQGKRHLERKIRIRMANAYMIIADHNNISNAKQEIKLATKDWDIDSEFDSRILYNLACWYEKFDRLHMKDADIPNARQNVWRYITYSLVRDCNPENHGVLRGWALEDHVLEDIRADLERLIPKIQKKLDDIPDLPEWKGRDYREALKDILPISTCNLSNAAI